MWDALTGASHYFSRIHKIILSFQCLYFRIFYSGQVGLWGLHLMLLIIWSIIFWEAQPTMGMACLGVSGPWSNGYLSFSTISCHDLQWTPVPAVATGSVAGCESCCPPPYYSSEFCKQQICDEVPSSVVTSSFISVARAVWHRDAFF